MKKRILISNSGRQYTHRLAYALQLNKYSFKFFTSFWFKPNQFPFIIVKILPKFIRKRIENEFNKRSFSKLNDQSISQFPSFEILREFIDKIFGNKYSERMQYYRDNIHDYYVSKKIDYTKFDLIIGYEECSLHTFRIGKEQGLITVLDLAQIHYKEIENIASKYPAFGKLYQDIDLRNKINNRKKNEIALADYIICLSEFAKASLVKHGLNKEKIFVVSLGFDPENFKPKKSYLSSGRLKVIYVGTITARKGIDILMQVNDELKEVMDLTLVGPMADARGLLEDHEGKYIWHNQVDQNSLNALLMESDLFVFPSYLDSWAMVVIEAMACGVPVIVSDNTGSSDIVKKGGGFVISTGNKNQLKEKIIYFYNNREELEKKGREAHQIALSYTWENYYKQVDDIICQL